MSRDARLYLEDILEACERIRRYMKDADALLLQTDSMRFDAVVRNLEIIGEAAGRLPESMRAEIHGVPWRSIMGMRNILAHAYFGIDKEIVWDVVTHDLPELEAAIRRYLV